MNIEPVGTADLADWLGVSSQSIAAFANDEKVVRVRRGKYDLKASVQAYTAHLRQVSAGRGGETAILDLTQERARLAREQADGQELKNKQSRGELVSTIEVASEWTDMVRLIRSNLLAVPARCRQRNAGFGTAEVELIRREITEALEAIAHDQDPAPPGVGDGDAASKKAAV